MPSTEYRVKVTPSERNVRSLVVKVRAESGPHALSAVTDYILHRANNHVTRLAASGLVDVFALRYEVVA